MLGLEVVRLADRSVRAATRFLTKPFRKPDNQEVDASGVRVTELLAALSFGADLGLGHPTEHVLRQTYIALHLAERLAMDEPEREVVYYASMLAWLGCHIDAYEQAKWFGDDQAFKHDAAYIDDADALGSVAFLLRHIGDGRPLAERVKAGVGFLADGRHDLAGTPSRRGVRGDVGRGDGQGADGEPRCCHRRQACQGRD